MIVKMIKIHIFASLMLFIQEVNGTGRYSEGGSKKRFFFKSGDKKGKMIIIQIN